MITAIDETSQWSGDDSEENNPSPGNMPDENAGETNNSDDEILYPHESETSPQEGGADTSFSEGIDVTPPNRKEVPSFGAAKTDFENRPLGRTTGRMIGHEPGTEGI